MPRLCFSACISLICLESFLELHHWVSSVSIPPSVLLSKGMLRGTIWNLQAGLSCFQKYVWHHSPLAACFSSLHILCNLDVSASINLWVFSLPIKCKSHICFRNLTYFLLHLDSVFFKPHSDRVTSLFDKKLLPHPFSFPRCQWPDVVSAQWPGRVLYLLVL